MAVKSFLQQDYPCSVVVIDNASKPESRNALVNSLSSVDRVSFIFNKSNLGFAGALASVVNEWVQNSKGPACITAAHDAYAEREAIGKLMEILLSEPDVGLAFPLRNPPEEGLWSPVRGSRLRPLPRSKVNSGNYVYGTYFPSPCIAIKRELLERGVGFDARLFAFREEEDLGLGAKKKGFRSVLVTGAVIENTEVSESVRGSCVQAYLIARNSVLIARKHSGRAAATLHVLYITLASLKNWISGAGRTPAFSSRARVRGVLDALKGRYGPPPEDLTKR